MNIRDIRIAVAVAQQTHWDAKEALLMMRRKEFEFGNMPILLFKDEGEAEKDFVDFELLEAYLKHNEYWFIGSEIWTHNRQPFYLYVFSKERPTA